AGVTGSDVEQVGIGIVGHAIPNGSAAAHLQTFRIPGGGRAAHVDVAYIFFLRRLGRIAGDGVEAPDELAGPGVVRFEVSAGGKVRARATDAHITSAQAG